MTITRLPRPFWWFNLTIHDGGRRGTLWDVARLAWDVAGRRKGIFQNVTQTDLWGYLAANKARAPVGAILDKMRPVTSRIIVTPVNLEAVVMRTFHAGTPT